MVTKTKKKILKEDLKMKGHILRGHCSREDLDELAKKYDVNLTSLVDVMEEGW